jgi:hypothetical protein
MQQNVFVRVEYKIYLGIVYLFVVMLTVLHVHKMPVFASFVEIIHLSLTQVNANVQVTITIPHLIKHAIHAMGHALYAQDQL